MENFKGTPGQWHYDNELGGIYSKSCLFVCDVADKDNANLISAAPELLEALQRCESVLSNIPLEVCDVEDLLYARSAIKKALGEKQ